MKVGLQETAGGKAARDAPTPIGLCLKLTTAAEASL